MELVFAVLFAVGFIPLCLGVAAFFAGRAAIRRFSPRELHGLLTAALLVACVISTYLLAYHEVFSLPVGPVWGP